MCTDRGPSGPATGGGGKDTAWNGSPRATAGIRRPPRHGTSLPWPRPVPGADHDRRTAVDSLARPERAGVVLRHPGRPIPSRRRLLISTAPAAGAAVLTGLAATWWTGRAESGPPWFPLLWIPVVGIAWLVLGVTRAQRPFLAHTQQRTDITAARHRALRAHRLPSSPSIRIGAAARSCTQLETMALLVAVGATAVAGAVLRPGLPWLPVLVVWGVLTAAALVPAGQSWAYLRLHEHPVRPHLS